MGDPQDQTAHQDLWEPQPHHHLHHHPQLSVSPSVSQPAQLPVAHRRNIKKWNSGINSFMGWILAFISIESFSGHHRARSTSFCDVLSTILYIFCKSCKG